jgi:RepB DNA-primase from phage plasmid
MNGDATAMLTALFADSTEGEFINLRRIHPDKPPVEEFIPAGDIEAAASWAIARRDAGDVYVGVLPRTRRAGGRDAVPRGAVVWADCDSPESVAALAQFSLEPSIVVMSGTGDNRHAYWLLDETIDSATIEQINRRLAATLGSDPRVCDAARILRVPGTRNHKHDPPTEVTLAACPGTRYTVAELQAAVAGDGDDAAGPAAVDKPPSAGDGPTGMVLGLLEDVRETGNGWMARCPAHDDERPSLSVAEGEGGRCLLHCFAGCAVEAIVQAIGLTVANLRGDTDDMGMSLAAVLVRLAQSLGVQLFHDAARVAYGRVPVDGRQEVWQLTSRRFRHWLRNELHRSCGRLAKADAITEAVESLIAMAQFDGPEIETHLRSAWTPDGTIAYNLANESGQVVRIAKDTWETDDAPEVAFLRRDGVLALPVPQPGASIELLRRYVNTGSDEDFLLVVSWAVMALRPAGPFPILIFQGEQGSGKSTTMRVLKMLVDPVKAPIRATPGSERDLVIAAASNSVIAIDNVSTLSPRTSDALCRLSTGGGFATRALYTDDEERVFEQMRAIEINGIDAVATRQDLLDRAILVRSPRISSREDEATFWQAFEADRRLILGALLDGAARAQSAWDDTPVLGSRMADFARWAAASMPAFGWSAERFADAYERNRSNALKASLEGSVLTQLVVKLLGAMSHVEDTPTAIHKQLAALIDEGERRSSGFPRSAQAMSKQLTMLAPALREIGIDVTTTAHGSGNRKTRWTVIRRIANIGDGTGGTGGTQDQTTAGDRR